MKARILINAFIGIVLLFGLGGCGSTAKQIPTESQSMRTDVFTEVKDQQPPPKGTVDLTIKGSIKIPPEGYYILEPRPSREGKEGYPFELNIDGQEIVWRVQGKTENNPRRDENGRIIPEGGPGIRYILEKKIRLKPGFHHVVFGLPDENYFTEVKVTLSEGEAHTLKFQPVYVMGQKHHMSFYHGIKAYNAFLNGNYIK